MFEEQQQQQHNNKESGLIVPGDIRKLLESHGYVVEKPIGQGGFATCFVVTSAKYENQFVCKVTEKQNSYNNELLTLRTADHNHLVRCYDYFNDSSYYVLILEYCTGGSLASMVQDKGPLTPPILYNYLIQLFDSLNFLHLNQIAHLDIKPSNILIDKYGRIKLTDFGMSKFFPKNMKCEQYAGTKLFLAPEVYSKNPYNPFKADIWALGITMHYLITGELLGNSFEEIMQFAKSQYFFFPPETPSFLQNIVYKCMQIKPELRPTVLQLKEMLLKGINSTIPCELCLPRSSTRQYKTTGKLAKIIKPRRSTLNQSPALLKERKVKFSTLPISYSHEKLLPANDFFSS